MKAKQTILAGGVACGVLAICGGLLMPGGYDRGATAMTKTEDVNVQFTFETTLTLDLSGDAITIADLVPGQARNSVKGGDTDKTTALTVTTTTNNSLGYTLTAKVGNDDEYDSTSLVADSGAEIASLGSGTALPTTGTTSAWGFSTDLGATFKGFSTVDEAVQLKKTEGPATDGDEVTFDIGAYASASQPAGTYQNVINFTSVTNMSE